MQANFCMCLKSFFEMLDLLIAKRNKLCYAVCGFSFILPVYWITERSSRCHFCNLLYSQATVSLCWCSVVLSLRRPVTVDKLVRTNTKILYVYPPSPPFLFRSEINIYSKFSVFLVTLIIQRSCPIMKNKKELQIQIKQQRSICMSFRIFLIFKRFLIFKLLIATSRC